MSCFQIATTAEERDAIYRLRYDVYVREFNYPFPASPERLSDCWDASAVHFALKDGEPLLGAMRVNCAVSLAHDEAVVERYQLGNVSGCPLENLYLASRAIFTREARGGRHLRHMLREVFRWGLDQEVRVCVIDSSPRLVPLYERLGWVRYADHFQDAALGERVPLLLRLTDHDYLRSISSPFSSVLESRELVGAGEDSPIGGWLTKQIADGLG